ncbi:MAG: RNA polymerase-binding protein DksA [Nitrospirae bacterium]|nr:RNA polymerase-binding protein DksA [Nitrospirota bacterium]
MKDKPKVKDKTLSVREQKFQEIRKKLLSQREELLTEADASLSALPEENVFSEMGDQASSDTDRGFMLRLRGREKKLLNKIEEAIEKIDSGNYGACEVCGEDINVKRLEARPVTTMCIDCKTEQEEEERLKKDI